MGQHELIADYLGDVNYTPATSLPSVVTVDYGTYTLLLLK